eukprot:scaffold3606_cov63-Attheya_sp.AAC.1
MSSKDDTFVRSSQTKGRRNRHSYSRVLGDHELRKLADQFDTIMQQPSLTYEDKNTKRKKERKKKERSKSTPRTSRAPSKYEEDN